MPEVGKICEKELEEMIFCLNSVKDSDFSIARERSIKLIKAATYNYNHDLDDAFINNLEPILDNFKDYIYKKCWPSKKVPKLYFALNDKEFKSLLSRNNIDIEIVVPILDKTRSEGNKVKHDSTREINKQYIQIIAVSLCGWIKGFCNVIDDIFTPKLKIVEVLNSKKKYNLEIDISSNHPVKVLQYEISISERKEEKAYHLVNFENNTIRFNEQDDNKYISIRALIEGFDDYLYSKVYGPIDWKKLKTPKQVQHQNNETKNNKGEKIGKTSPSTNAVISQKADNTLKVDDEIVNRLSNIFERVCNKYIFMKYGMQGIKSAYISEISPKEPLIGLKATYRYFEDLLLEYSKLLADNTSDDDVRILFTGDVCSGRTTQLLNLCKQSTANRSRFFIYVTPASLNHQNLTEYIYNTYLKDLTKFKNMVPEEAFYELKKTFEKQKKITIVFDDYDKNEKQIKEDLDKLFKFESGLINGVDVIVKTRYRDGSWPQNYLEVVSVGIPENRIRNILKDNGIVIDLLQIPGSCLKSPWLLKLLVEEVSNEFRNISNPGRLIRKSIDKRVETSARDGINIEILRFSVNALLPHISNLRYFDKVLLYNSLPQLVREVAEMGIVPESFVALDYLDSIEKSKTKVYDEFFGNPIVQTMGLMREVKKENASRIILEWKDFTVGSVFCATEIVNFFSNELYDEAFKLLNEIVEHLLQMENIAIQDEIDTSIFNYFDSARYVIDLLDEDILSRIIDLYPEQFAYLYCGLAVVYELSGNEIEKYDASVNAMALLNKLLKEGSNRVYIAHWLSKMSYYVIKCNEVQTDEFSGSLMLAQDCLNSSVDFYENRRDLLTEHDRFELSKIYGNMGAYFLRIKNYDRAREWHEKSLEEKKICLESNVDGLEKKELEEGIRRSLVSIATDLFYLKRYEESIDYHDKAIEVGTRIHSRNRYESYSRKVGSYIKMYDQNRDWSTKNADFLFSILEEDIKIMGKYINKKELQAIYGLGKLILSSLFNYSNNLDYDQLSQIKNKAIEIEELFNKTTWANQNELTRFFMEG